MRLQDSQANCGPVALGNALKAMGLERSTEELEKLCKTSATAGTSVTKMVLATSALGNAYKIVEAKADVAMLRLSHALRSGRPVLLCVDAGAHWVAAVGMLGQRFLVADSADNELVLSYGAEGVEKRWRDSRYVGVVL